MRTPWLQTYSGQAYDLIHPNPEILTISDIAHALSQINRYTGHTLFPYSVAQHSCLVAMAVPRAERLAALTHDVHEIVTGDMASPIKATLRAMGASAWDEFEAVHARAFRRRFGVPGVLSHAVREADFRALVTEFAEVMGPGPAHWTGEDLPEIARLSGFRPEGIPMRIEYMAPGMAARMWLDMVTEAA